MLFLLWYDDSKKSVATKVAEGAQAFRDRFGYPPVVVVMNERDLTPVGDLDVRSEGYIRPNNFWFGIAEAVTP